MSPTYKHVKDAASDLPAAERVQLAKFLLRSIDTADEATVRAEWLAVAERRMAEIKAGKFVGVPADKVLRRLLRPKR